MAVSPCNIGLGFLVLQDTGPCWTAEVAFCGPCRKAKVPSAVGQGRGTVWPGLGKGQLLPSPSHTAAPGIPVRVNSDVTENKH